MTTKNLALAALALALAALAIVGLLAFMRYADADARRRCTNLGGLPVPDRTPVGWHCTWPATP